MRYINRPETVLRLTSSARCVMTARDFRRWRWIVVLTSATLFIVSLTQIAFVVDVTVIDRVDPREFSGIVPLLFGWGGLLLGPSLFDFRGVGYDQNLLVWPSTVAAWALACMKRWLAAAIAALFTIGLISIPYIPIPDTVGYAAWLANPGIAIAWIFYLSDKQPAALISAVVSVGLALSFLWVQDGPFGPKQLDPVPIISHGIGYWLWVASAAILVAGMSVDKFLFRYVPLAGRQSADEADCEDSVR
jgi:hypothetical protein